MYESEDQFEQFFPDNSKRRKRQKKLDIRVIVGNPPYSAGQASANDDNPNVAYPKLDERIRKTYAEDSSATNKNSLYDTYIRAIRWASDRLGNSGVLGFVTNAGFLDAKTADGVRKHLFEEFASIYVLHLRGNQRTSGERSRREGGKLFGSGSRAPIAITLMVKNSAVAKGETNRAGATIRWYEVEDYLTREEKLAVVSDFKSISAVSRPERWQLVEPDAHHDWSNQRDESFDDFIKIGDKHDEQCPSLFDVYSMGIKTNRDAWAYRSSKGALLADMRSMNDFFNTESQRYAELVASQPAGHKKPNVEKVVALNSKRISWSRALRHAVAQGKQNNLDESFLSQGLYRPFSRQHLFFDRFYVNDVAQIPRFFPEPSSMNRVISVTGPGAGKPFSTLMMDRVPNLHTLDTSQCFPLYVYSPKYEEAGEIGLFGEDLGSGNHGRIDAVSDRGLIHFRAAYQSRDNGHSITKEDLFYYIYGILHSPEYRERYKNNLSKELPRIPAVKKFAEFQAFSQAGRDLAHWHLDYETVECYPVTLDFTGGPQKLSDCKDEHFYVRKMKPRRVKDADTKKSIKDRTTVIYNEYITVRGIPLEAYDYVVNGKSAIEWVIERQAVTTDKKSGIVNDANLWATETMGNARYPLELLQRIITVSLETMKIVNTLPALDID